MKAYWQSWYLSYVNISFVTAEPVSSSGMMSVIHFCDCAGELTVLTQREKYK